VPPQVGVELRVVGALARSGRKDVSRELARSGDRVLMFETQRKIHDQVHSGASLLPMPVTHGSVIAYLQIIASRSALNEENPFGYLDLTPNPILSLLMV
jgi:hypothetical protein